LEESLIVWRAVDTSHQTLTPHGLRRNQEQLLLRAKKVEEQTGLRRQEYYRPGIEALSIP
jgi:hypothetical protein